MIQKVEVVPASWIFSVAFAATLGIVLYYLTNHDRTPAVWWFAHGAVRYHSDYIPGGRDDTPFCYQFDAESGRMVACRPLLSTNNPRQN